MSPEVYLACEAWTSNIPVTTCITNFLTTSINPSLGVISFQTCPSTGVFTVSNTIQVSANPIFLKYRLSDLPILQKASSTWGLWPGITLPSSTTTTGATTHSSPESSNDNTGTVVESGGGLSQQSKIAIGVTIPIVFLAFALGIFIVVRRRKKMSHDLGPADAQTQFPELDSQNVQRNESKAVELEGKHDTMGPTAELDTGKPQLINQTGRPAEMDTPQRVAELEAHGGTWSGIGRGW